PETALLNQMCAGKRVFASYSAAENFAAFFAGFLRGLADFSALSAGSAVFFLRPFGASDGAPAFLRPAARRGCELGWSARASSKTTASVRVMVSGVLSPVIVALMPLWLTYGP